MDNVVEYIGTKVIEKIYSLGSFVIFLYTIFYTLFTTRLKVKQTLIQMEKVGIESVIIVVLTGISAGFAMALQGYNGFSKIGGQEFIGIIVALGITRELAPVLTGLMVTGRAASAMAAQLGTMQITEEIDALKTLRINPYQYLVIPRVLAATIVLPFLTVISMLAGIMGGAIYSGYVLDINNEVYIMNIQNTLTLSDIIGGLIKSSVFGLILSIIASYKGFFVTRGTQGVALATTKTVVLSSILILIANYFLSVFLF